MWTGKAGDVDDNGVVWPGRSIEARQLVPQTCAVFFELGLERGDPGSVAIVLGRPVRTNELRCSLQLARERRFDAREGRCGSERAQVLSRRYQLLVEEHPEAARRREPLLIELDGRPPRRTVRRRRRVGRRRPRGGGLVVQSQMQIEPESRVEREQRRLRSGCRWPQSEGQGRRRCAVTRRGAGSPRRHQHCRAPRCARRPRPSHHRRS
jgi:hypothetical protein